MVTCAVLVLCAFCYFYRIGDKPLDFDERYSVNIAMGTGGIPDQYAQFGLFTSEPIPGAVFSSGQYAARSYLRNVVAAAMNDNGQGIPYFILLHGWLKAFGTSTVAARSLSALLMLASLVLLYQLFRRLQLGHGPSTVVMALFALNGVIIGLAQYTRFYSLGILLVLISVHLTLTVLESNRGVLKLFILGAVWSVLFLNQYFGAFVILPEAIYIWRAVVGRNQFKNLSLALIGFALPVFVWLIPLEGWESLRNIYVLHQKDWPALVELTTPTTLLNVVVAATSSFAGAFGQPVNFLHGNNAAALQILPAIPAILLAVLATWRLKNEGWVRLCIGVLGVYLMMSVLHSISTKHTLLFQVRYWVFAYVFSYGLIACIWAKNFAGAKHLKVLFILTMAVSFARVAYTSASAISGLALTANLQWKPLPVQPLEDYEALAVQLKNEMRESDTLSFQNWNTAQIVNWYLLDRPDIVQRVDAAQPSLIMVCQGAGQRTSVDVPRGRGLHAQPVW